MHPHRFDRVACPSDIPGGARANLLAHRAQGGLAREHHRGSLGSEPEIVAGSFRTDHAADGHEKTGEEQDQHELVVYRG